MAGWLTLHAAWSHAPVGDLPRIITTAPALDGADVIWMAPSNALSLEDARSAQDRREVEWQMATADLAPVRRWLSRHETVDQWILEPRSCDQLRDTYLDTADWRVFRAGYALRVRLVGDRSEATLKSLMSARADLADRREITETLTSAQHADLTRSAGPVARRIRAVAAGHALRPLFEVQTRRERFAIRGSGVSAALGEIALDESVVLRREGEPAASFLRVEVEALGTRHRPLERIAKLLQEECGLEPARESKYELGLSAVGIAPVSAPRLAPVHADESMRASEAALARLRRLLIEWFAHEPGARLGDDTACLHDLRIAVRRMDGALRLFEPYLPTPLRRSRCKLKAVLRALGAVRDLDVQLEELARLRRGLSEADRESLAPLQRLLASQRGRSRARMLASLDAKSTRRWLDDSTTLLAQPSAPQPPGFDPPAIVVAAELIDRRFRKLRKAYRRLTENASMQDIHDVRRQVKKLRYAVESFDTIYGKPAEQFERRLRRLRRLQDDLGRHQDACVMERMLLAVACDPPRECSPRALFLMGRFAEHCCAARERACARIDKRWRKVRVRWKTLRSSLEDLRDRSSSIDPASNGESIALPASTADGVDTQSPSTPTPTQNSGRPQVPSPRNDA